MAEGATGEERETLLDGNQSVENSRNVQEELNWVAPEPFVCFHSLSVGYRASRDGDFSSGSLDIVRIDTGGKDDFNSIALDLVWRARGGESAKVLLPIDDFIAYRVLPPASKPSIAVQKKGGAIWGYLEFAAGPSSFSAFERTMKENATLIPVSDAFRDGRLMGVDAKPRMRVAVRLIDDEVPLSYGSLNTSLPVEIGNSNENVGMKILEGFAMVTQFTRSTVRKVASQADRRAREERKKRIRESAIRLGATDLSTQIIPSTDDVNALPPILKAERQRGIPVSPQVWQSHLDSDGRLIDPTMLRHAVFCGGIERPLRSTLWPILLGVVPWDSTEEERDDILKKKHTEFLALHEEWTNARDQAHNAANNELNSRKSPIIESEEQIAKDIVRTDRTIPLYAPDDAVASSVLSDLLNLYAYYDQKIGYGQGMSDCASQLVYHLAPEGGETEEALAFWCFVELMKRIECNFRVDQSGMHSQLGRLQRVVKKMGESRKGACLSNYFEETDPEMFTFFRWIIVRFKRELSFDDTGRLWDVLWTRHVGGDMLHIYIAAGLLYAYKERILSFPPGQFDVLLKFINDLSGRIDVDFAIREGELAYRELGAVE